MAVAWVDVGGSWSLQHRMTRTLEALGYEVVGRGQGWTDFETGRRAILLDITGDGDERTVLRRFSTGRWPDRD